LLLAILACTRTESSDRRAPGASTAMTPTPIVRGIDHFFATSPTPETHYRYFRDSLGLPEVYPFWNYGDFASGVVSMGNVLFEVVTWDVPAGDTLPIEFKGIAFEPAERLPVTLTRMREHGILVQAPESVMYDTPDSTKALAYINIPLDGPRGLSPTTASIFINDNLGSPRAAARRRESAEELVRRGGGPLGVLAVKELVIGVEDVDAALAQWRRLLESPAQESEGVITFPAGPAMRFVKAPVGAILEMVVQVRSLAQAERFLSRKGAFRREGEHVLIEPSSVGGLRIRLVE
jgi:hypothetical protein